jgi:glycogen debranching enzyme
MGSRVPESLVLSSGPAFAVLNSRGDIRLEDNPEAGLFFDDTRYLSRSTLELVGADLRELSSDTTREYVSQVDLTLASERRLEGIDDPKLFFHLRRRQLIEHDMVERVELSNYHHKPVDVELVFRHEADFADLFEVRGFRRKERGELEPPEVVDIASYDFGYEGRDHYRYRTRVRYGRAPNRLAPGFASFQVRLEPLGSWSIDFTVIMGREGVDRPRAPAPFARRVQRLVETHAEWHAESTAVDTDDDYFTQSIDLGLSDLCSLSIRIDGLPTVTAGIPWFAAPFGRDSLITSFQALPLTTRPARETLTFLARHQGKKYDEERDEEPGKIPHEYRRGELARTAEIPHRPYYGSVDATPLFLVLADEYVRFTADLRLIDTIAPELEAAVRWILTRCERDIRGLLTYDVGHGGRLRNQGWKDSGDAICFPDASLAAGPIALVEVQGYAIDGLERAAGLLEKVGRPEIAGAARRRATALRETIENLYFDERGACALAIDGKGERVSTRTSNPGHLLFSSAIGVERARSISAGLLAGGLWAGWGIRTLSAEHAAYNPLSYHRGSVWPHENSMIAFGMARYGWTRDAAQILRAMYEASLHFHHYRLPELFCGIGPEEADFPVRYPVACNPQAWASSAPFLLLRSALGIFPDATKGELRIHNPTLPAWLGFVQLDRFRVGQSRLKLRFGRTRAAVAVEVLEQEGDPIRVLVELAPQT